MAQTDKLTVAMNGPDEPEWFKIGTQILRSGTDRLTAVLDEQKAFGVVAGFLLNEAADNKKTAADFRTRMLDLANAYEAMASSAMLA